MRQIKFSTTDKYEVDGYFNLKTSIHSIMHTFFIDISEYGGNLEGIIDEGAYKNNTKYAQDWLKGKLLQVC